MYCEVLLFQSTSVFYTAGVDACE